MFKLAEKSKIFLDIIEVFCRRKNYQVIRYQTWILSTNNDGETRSGGMRMRNVDINSSGTFWISEWFGGTVSFREILTYLCWEDKPYE